MLIRRFHSAVITISILVFCNTGCRDGKTTLMPDYLDYQIRKVAWESLTESDRKTVIEPWHQAQISECRYFQTDQPAACVTFHTNLDALLGPIVVYVDKEHLQVLGFGLRY